MGHEKHLLEGVILDTKDYGESGKLLQILTKDQGIVFVVALGVRDQSSKMRGSMEVLEMVNFEFVEGKEINRLVGIFPIKNLFPKNISGKELIAVRRVISNVVNFVIRTVLGQTKNEKLWESFLEGFQQIAKLNANEKINKNFFQSLEIIWIIKILVSLGYWPTGKNDDYSEENIKYLEDNNMKKELIDEINKAILDTHL